MSLPLEFVINRPPVSQQTRRQARLRQWREEVQSVARQHWPDGEPPTDGLLMVTINYFYSDKSLDIDNVPKPVIDSLKEIVFRDDSQVTDLLCRKRRLSPNLDAIIRSSVLAEGLRRGNDFVYIAVERAPDQEIVV